MINSVRITNDILLLCVYRAPTRRGGRRTHGTGTWTFEGPAVHANNYFNIYKKNFWGPDLVLYQD